MWRWQKRNDLSETIEDIMVQSKRAGFPVSLIFLDSLSVTRPFYQIYHAVSAKKDKQEFIVLSYAYQHQCYLHA